MKQLTFKDVFISLLVSIFIILFFYVFLSIMLAIGILFLASIFVLVLNIVMLPFIEGTLTIADVFGDAFNAGLIKFAFITPLSLLLTWQFYVAVIIISILDLTIRKLNLVRITKSPYLNAMIIYLSLGIIVGLILEFMHFKENDITLFLPTLFSIFFLLHFHLAIFLQYLTQQHKDGKFKSIWDTTIASKLKRHSVSDNDNEF